MKRIVVLTIILIMLFTVNISAKTKESFEHFLLWEDDGFFKWKFLKTINKDYRVKFSYEYFSKQDKASVLFGKKFKINNFTNEISAGIRHNLNSSSNNFILNNNCQFKLLKSILLEVNFNYLPTKTNKMSGYALIGHKSNDILFPAVIAKHTGDNDLVGFFSRFYFE